MAVDQAQQTTGRAEDMKDQFATAGCVYAFSQRLEVNASIMKGKNCLNQVFREGQAS